MKCCNTYDFDYTENYMALLACIVSEMTVDESVRKIALQHKRDRRKNLLNVLEIKMDARKLMYLILKPMRCMNLIVVKKQHNNLE